MKRIALLILSVVLTITVFAQTTPEQKKKTPETMPGKQKIMQRLLKISRLT